MLFFYPRADTPGCTKEAIDFTRLSSAFTTAGTAVVGVSGDPPKAQEAFRNKHKLGVPLASDEKHWVLESFGAWGEKSMYGRRIPGHPSHHGSDRPGRRIIKIWRNVRVDGHADEVLPRPDPHDRTGQYSRKINHDAAKICPANGPNGT